ncbi:alpha-amylase family glycosyl hydrolase [Flavobacterium tegetincola]|uniref:alpha-amylase family glycosyl hydrolase n=1 Tax=Flavobacterium tegetincola TaxID=150172 RepID=UPI00040E3E09|nr:alpha-amylase family glycosyl hydrolase [Flavobacterium tegetincola]
MRKITLLLLFLNVCAFAQTTTIPAPALAEGSVEVRFNKAGTPLATYTGIIYAHIGLTVNGVQWQNVKGTWGNNTLQPALTLVSGTTYKLTLGPDLYTSFGIPTTSTITQICVVFRAASGAPQSADTFLPVGAFQLNLTAPVADSATILVSGASFTVAANNTGGTASYVLKANGTTVNSIPSTSNYTFTQANITANQNYTLEATQGSSTITRKFSVIVNGGAVTEGIPTGLKDGVNYNTNDATKATLVLSAPNKDFIYIAGSFNNWEPNASYAMKNDPASGKFWLELTGLTPGTVYTYQYWVGDQTNLPATSPAMVKTADPFSILVLSPFDDPEIAALGVYPNLPAYPAGQEREVSVLQTGPTAFYQYNWSAATTNFVKPNVKDLVIYEVLVRDFDANRTYQNLIDRIDYFKNLKINAIQLMPVMEFEGNESWGYNTSFHMALDKRYGSEAKLKEFIDLCHQNGIAVILDVALNHVFGRSPLARMWMKDTDNDGWDNGTTAENPYANANAMHSYNVGTDLNHYNEPNNLTGNYVKQTIERWMNDFKIDGFRWDLTKGFTQNCPYTGSGSAQDACTNSYQADRVAKLKYYADLQWNIDPNFYVIFEHLGTGGSYNEEVEWANYRKTAEPDGISKGIMQWRKMTDAYANFLKGNSTNLSGVADASDRFIGYAESHDEERVVYKALTESGQTLNNLPKVLKRLSAMGALHLLVPGPKMIYHFGELGYDDSIFTCNNGTVNSPTDSASGDCKLDTKPQNQWTGNWLANVARKKVYDDWSRMIDLKKNENVFENGQHSWNFSTTGKPRLDIYTSTTATPNLSYVFVLTNATNSDSNTAGNFPYTGVWYNLMDGTPLTVTSTTQTVAIEADGFKVFGNKQAFLSQTDFNATKVVLQPNPSTGTFFINTDTQNVVIYNLTGQLVKEFKGSFDSSHSYSIDGLTDGVYLVRITDANNNQSSMKLIKR